MASSSESASKTAACKSNSLACDSSELARNSDDKSVYEPNELVPGPSAASSANDELDIQADVVLRSNTAEVPEATLKLRAVHSVASCQALLQLSQELPLRGRKTKTSFYVHVAPERIQHLEYAGRWYHSALGEVYDLRLVLCQPPDLIGPPWEWKGKSRQVDDTIGHLKALAATTHLTLLVPTRTLGEQRLAALCQAASAHQLLSHSRFFQSSSLYGGRGGCKYEVPPGAAPAPAPPPYGRLAETTGPHPPPYVAGGVGSIEGTGAKRRRSSSSGDSAIAASSSRKQSRLKTRAVPHSSPAESLGDGDSKSQLLGLHWRLDTLQSQLANEVLKPLHGLSSRVTQLQAQLDEFLAEHDAAKSDEEVLRDTVLDLQEAVEKLSDTIGTAEMRIEDVNDASLLEAIEVKDMVHDWVKDYTEDAVGDLMDDAVAKALKANVRDVETMVKLLRETPKIAKAIGLPSSPRDSGTSHGQCPVLDSSRSTPEIPASEVSDAANDGGEKGPATARHERKTLALESIARASERNAASIERIATAFERIASTYEASNK